MIKSSTLKAILIPALVFQSVVIAGGYCTGRELVEFFLKIGPWNGLLGMAVSAILWSVVCAVTFEFARRFKAYNYRQFFQSLLGKAWIIFEITYLALSLIVLGVIASSAASILEQMVGLTYKWGALLVITYICFMVWRGERLIERALSFWSIMLYVMFSLFLLACFNRYGVNIVETFNQESSPGPWVQQGITYASYNLGLMPAVLFAVHHCQTQTQSICSGLLAGLFTILPGIGFFIAMCGFYPEIVDQTVPSTYILTMINNPLLTFTFHLVLLGTITETGTSIIHSINQRIESAALEKGKVFPKKGRPMVACLCLLITFGLSQLGLVALISKGYGTLAWLMILVYVVPILTIGVVKMRGSNTVVTASITTI